MPGHKNPLRPMGARARAAELVAADRERRLAEQLLEPGPLDRFLNSFVTDALLSSGDETQATPALRRRIPEPDVGTKSAGSQGAGDGQHLYAVPAPVIQIERLRRARERRLSRGIPRPTRGSAA